MLDAPQCGDAARARIQRFTGRRWAPRGTGRAERIEEDFDKSLKDLALPAESPESVLPSNQPIGGFSRLRPSAGEHRGSAHPGQLDRYQSFQDAAGGSTESPGCPRAAGRIGSPGNSSGRFGLSAGTVPPGFPGTGKPQGTGGSHGMHVFFSVGEPSGDQHAAHLIIELRRAIPACGSPSFRGPRMSAAGFESCSP